jgi:hypothetical protein
MKLSLSLSQISLHLIRGGDHDIEVVAEEFTFGRIVPATDLRPALVYGAPPVPVQVHATAFDELVPPVVAYIDAYGIELKLPLEIFDFTLGCGFEYPHAEILAA